MFKEPLLERNWDGKQLAADHSQPRAFGGTRADRLLHGNCNSQRGDGSRDHERPVILGVHPSQWTAALALSDHPAAATDDSYAMDW